MDLILNEYKFYKIIVDVTITANHKLSITNFESFKTDDKYSGGCRPNELYYLTRVFQYANKETSIEKATEYLQKLLCNIKFNPNYHYLMQDFSAMFNDSIEDIVNFRNFRRKLKGHAIDCYETYISIRCMEVVG